MLCSTFCDDSFFKRSLDRVFDGASLLGSLLVQGAVDSVIYSERFVLSQFWCCLASA